MKVNLATISFPKCPDHVAQDDAARLKAALVKKWPDRRIDVVTVEHLVYVEFKPKEETNVLDAGQQGRDMRLFADGFMASASLWER